MVERRGLPQVVERRGVPQVVERRGVPQVVERRRVPQLVEREVQKSLYRTVPVCVLMSMWGPVDPLSSVPLSAVTVPCCQPPSVGKLSPARGLGRQASCLLWTQR